MVIKELGQDLSRRRRVVGERWRSRQVDVNFVADASVVAATRKLNETAPAKARSVARLNVAELLADFRSRVVKVEGVRGRWWNSASSHTLKWE